jgi:SAM-dependent methyltransferase
MNAMTPRSCPLCGNNQADVVVVLEAAEFCSANWTYRQDFREIVSLPERAEFPIVRCNACRFVFAALLPGESFLRKVYEEVIRHEDCVAGSENEESYATRLRNVATLIELAPRTSATTRALDFGSGAGVTLRILAACGVEAAGFDPSAKRVQYGAGRGVSVVASLPEVQASAPYAMVVADNVLEHVPEPRETVAFIRTCVETGAIVFVSVPAYEEPFLAAQLERHRKRETLDITLNPWEHLNYFSLRHLDRLMNESGFERLRAIDLPSPPPIGLRPERSRIARWKNGASSALRLARFAVTGDIGATAERAFYRCVR